MLATLGLNPRACACAVRLPTTIRRWSAAIAVLVLSLGLAVPAQALTFKEQLRSKKPDQLMDWGKRYQHGVGAQQDIDRAIQLYCAAARLGHVEAKVRLGEIYSRRLTGKQDEVLAAAWLVKAQIGKSSTARSMLARWDLSAVNLPADPQCVLSKQMVMRTLPPAGSAQTKGMHASTNTTSQGQAKTTSRRDAAHLRPHPRREEIARLVRELAPAYRLDPDLVLAVIQVESNFNPRALSSKQAQGLMQLIPATAARFGVTDPYDPHENLRGGMGYLRWLLDHFNGDLRLALAGYNAGEGAVKRHGGVPPYTETREYVRRIARVLGVAENELHLVPARANTKPVRAGSEGSGTLTSQGDVPSSGAPGRTGSDSVSDRSEGDWESRFFDMGRSG